jgi:hypothetical protein
MWPRRSMACVTSPFAVRRIRRRPYSPRPMTSAESSPSPNSTRSPTRIFRPGRTRASHSCGEICLVRRIRFRRTEIRARCGDCGLAFPREPSQPAKEPRRDDARIVHDDQLIAAEQVRQERKCRILPSTLLRDPRSTCGRHPVVREGRLGDQLRRKLELKVGKAHSVSAATIRQVCRQRRNYKFAPNY